MAITKDSLILIEEGGDNISTSVEAVAGIVSPIATHAEAPTPIPGLVLPGTGLTIDPATGRLDSLVMEKSLRFRGLVGSGTNELESPLGGEDAGDFYIVQEDAYTLNGDWGVISAEVVNSGDFLIFATNNEFEILTDVIGGDSITEITSGTASVRVVEVSDGRLEIFSDVATPATSGAGGTDGLVTAIDKEKIDNLSATYLPLAGGNITGSTKINMSSGNATMALELIPHPTNTGDVLLVNDVNFDGFFRVRDDGGRMVVSVGKDSSTPFIPQEDHEIATKKFVDDEIIANDISVSGGQVKGHLLIASDLGVTGSSVEDGKIYEFVQVHTPGPGVASEYLEIGSLPSPEVGDVFTATKSHTFRVATDTLVVEVIEEASLSVAGHITTSGELYASKDAQFGADINLIGSVYQGVGDDKKEYATQEYVDANAGGDPFVGGSITEELVIEENVNIRIKGGTLIVEDDGSIDLGDASYSSVSAIPKQFVSGIVHLDQFNRKAAGITIRRKSNGMTAVPCIKLYSNDDTVADMEVWSTDNHKDIKLKASRPGGDGPYMYLGDDQRPAKTSYAHSVMTRKAVEEITDAIIARLDAGGL